jgi:hypothetical protein
VTVFDPSMSSDTIQSAMDLSGSGVAFRTDLLPKRLIKIVARN